MQYHRFGRTGWDVSEVGYGMWAMGGQWDGAPEEGVADEASLASLDRAVELGCNFFDTAWAYGAGRSERLLGRLLARHPDRRLYTATRASVGPEAHVVVPVAQREFNSTVPTPGASGQATNPPCSRSYRRASTWIEFFRHV